MKPDSVIILSGGMDSTTLLYTLLKEGRSVHALSFDYGQRHKRELLSAAETCRKNNVPHLVIAFPPSLQALLSASALTNSNAPMPHGHYAAENMKLTVVPNRNMIMLALAAAHAMSIGAKRLYYGAHSGDHTIYPDCRPVFFTALSTALQLAHFDDGVTLFAPFMYLNKNDICILGTELGVPYEDTWTCYEGGLAPCGQCGACQERAEAFAVANRHDPLLTEED